MKIKTIAFFSGFYLPFLGGVERFTEKLSEQFLKLGYRVIIVTSNHAQLPPVEEMDGRKIYRLPTKKLFRERYPLLDKNQEFSKLMAELETEEIDYLICNTRFQLTTLLGLQFAKKQKLPSLVIDHGSSHFSVNNKLVDFFGAIYEHLLTSVIKSYPTKFYAVSQRSADWLKHFKIQASGLIYNSVDSDIYDRFKDSTFLDKGSGQTIITYAGRLIREKGVQLLLEAFQNLPESEGLELVIAGDGPMKSELEEKYNRPDIHFVGRLDFPEVMSLMNQTDIFVYPSMFPEGMPTSILEAGMLKCAVIATDRGGTAEVITDDSLGMIVEENSKAVEEALKFYLNNPEKILSSGQKLQDRILSEFTWEKTAKHLLEVISTDGK